MRRRHTATLLLAIGLTATVVMAAIGPPGATPLPKNNIADDTNTNIVVHDPNTDSYTKLKITTSSTDKLKIKKIYHWDNYLSRWDDITSTCTYPAGFVDDPQITLPISTSGSDVFRVDVTTDDGGDANSTVDITEASWST